MNNLLVRLKDKKVTDFKISTDQQFCAAAIRYEIEIKKENISSHESEAQVIDDEVVELDGENQEIDIQNIL